VEHTGHCLDDAFIQRVLETGSLVSFQVAQHGKVDADAGERLARQINDYFRLGYGAQVLISPNFDRRSLLRAYGGAPGWVYLLERFPLILMEAGLDASMVRQLLVDNPQRALTIQRETPA
jgi:phosphotriesterase-related protein